MTDNIPEKPDEVSLLQVERYIAGELKGKELQAFRQRCDSDPRLKQWVDSQKTIISPVPVESILGRIERSHAEPESVEAEYRVPPRRHTGSSPWTQFSEMLGRLFKGPALIAAGAACLLLLALHFRNPLGFPEPAGGSPYISKGNQSVLLMHKGVIYQPGDTLQGLPGDTLSFAHRHGDTLHFQAWYEDDGGDIYAYVENSGMSYSLAPSLSFQTFPFKVVLDENWKEEALYIVYGKRPFTSSEAHSAIQRTDEPGSSLVVNRNTIVNSRKRR